MLSGRYGPGRSLTILLGHDAEAMENPGFQTLFRRAVEWAATGRVSRGQARPGAGPWRWEKAAGSSLSLVGPAGPLWQFRYDPALDHAYFHPLRTTDGRLLTWDRPPDHIWHHGLWFSWKYINKVNYWEVDTKTGRPAGRTSWSNVRISFGGPRDTDRHGPRLQARRGRAPVLTEKRTIEVSRPDAEGVYAIDWTAPSRRSRTPSSTGRPCRASPGAGSPAATPGCRSAWARGFPSARP